MRLTAEQLTYSVRGTSCGHCRTAITSEVEKVAGVATVDVDLNAKRVIVVGEDLDDAAVRAANNEAGYDVRLTCRSSTPSPGHAMSAIDMGN